MARDRDLQPSRPRRDLQLSRPRLAKMSLEASVETETKSRDSITGNQHCVLVLVFIFPQARQPQ